MSPRSIPRNKPREKRLAFLHRGNTHCPICLVEFTEACVTKGQSVTLEHAPPKGQPFGGSAVCLTCEDCNNRAGGSSDQALVMSRRPPKAELDINGHMKVSARYYSEGLPKLPFQFSSTPAGNRLRRQLDESTVVVAAVTTTKEALTIGQITCSVKEPDPGQVEAGYLKSAYLLVFSLLGKSGYLYAQSEAVRPIREQIMHPDGRLGRSLVRAFRHESEKLPNRMVIMRNKQEPFCWIVRIDDRCVLLPQGGSLDDYRRVAQLPGAVDFGTTFVGWNVKGLRFGSVCVDLHRLRHYKPSDGKLFGTEFVTVAHDGLEQRWVVVNQAEDVFSVAPCGPKMPRSTEPSSSC